jgi:hypothetical protein
MNKDIPETFEEAVDATLFEMRKTMIDKQRDYGPGNIADFGELGVLIRSNDKIARLKNLLYENPNEPTNESIDDTWLDIGNYALIAMMLRRNLWGLPLKEQLDAGSPAHFTLSY